MDEFSQIFHPVEKLKRIREDVKPNLGLFFTLAAIESVKNRKAVYLCYWYKYRLTPLHIFSQKALVEILSLKSSER